MARWRSRRRVAVPVSNLVGGLGRKRRRGRRRCKFDEELVGIVAPIRYVTTRQSAFGPRRCVVKHLAVWWPQDSQQKFMKNKCQVLLLLLLLLVGLVVVEERQRQWRKKWLYNLVASVWPNLHTTRPSELRLHSDWPGWTTEPAIARVLYIPPKGH